MIGMPFSSGCSRRLASSSQPPTWGNIIAGGRQNLQDAPHIVFFPSVVMFLTVLAFNLAGDRLREVLEVKEGAL